jgi:hypothetical protein
MIKIENPAIFAKCVADALVTIDSNTSINTAEKLRLVNAVGKAASRIHTDGSFMDYDGDAERLIIWSQGSNNVYELSPGRSCGCLADQNAQTCWHRVAKRLIVLYNAAMLAALASDYVSDRSQETATPKTAIVANLQPNEMPYLQPADSRRSEIVGGVRI